MVKIASMDLWDQLGLSLDEIDHPLKLGQSRSEDVIKYMKLPRRRLVTYGESEQFGAPLGWKQVRGEMIELLFDTNDVWRYLSYGHQADVLTWQVQTTITREAGQDAPHATAGEMPLLLRGHPLERFATLPNFAALTALSGSGEEGPQWSMRGREYDKWLAFSTVQPRGQLSAEFLLMTNKPRFESRFEIDYCLHKLSISSPDSVWPTLHGADPA